MPAINTQYEAAIDLYRNENYIEASNLLSNIIKTDLQFTPAYIMRAFCNAKLGQDNELLVDVNYLIDSNFDLNNFSKEMILIDGPGGFPIEMPIENFYTQVLEHFDKTYTVKNAAVREAEAAFLVGGFYMMIGNVKKTIPNIEKAASIIPEDEFIKDFLQMSIAAAQFVKLQEAMKYEREEDKVSQTDDADYIKHFEFLTQGLELLTEKIQLLEADNKQKDNTIAQLKEEILQKDKTIEQLNKKIAILKPVMPKIFGESSPTLFTEQKTETIEPQKLQSPVIKKLM